MQEEGEEQEEPVSLLCSEDDTSMTVGLEVGSPLSSEGEGGEGGFPHFSRLYALEEVHVGLSCLLV